MALSVLVVSLDHFNLARPPGLREERFEWTVEAKQSVPALGRVSLNPVAVVHTSRLGRAEIHRGRAIGARDCGRGRIALAARPGIALWCLVPLSR